MEANRSSEHSGTLAFICEIAFFFFKITGHSKYVINISTKFTMYGAVNADFMKINIS